MARRFALAACVTWRNELKLLGRDPFLVALMICFSAGLATASWISCVKWRNFANQQTESQAASREEWLSQPTENAHMATHVGQMVFKPISPLAGFDPGSVASFGTSILLQAHQQSSAEGDKHYDELDLVQDEAYAPAVLLELFGPLLIIVLGNASISREQEGGTLSMVLATALSWRAIIIGKSLAVILSLFVIAIPGLLLLIAPAFESTRQMNFMDLLIRGTVIFATLTAYFIGWVGLTMLVSLKSRSTNGSLSVLVAIWSITAFAMPRVAGDVATIVSPLPTSAEIRKEKVDIVRDANQSSFERTKTNKALEARLLKEFGVERIEDLPIDLAGARMMEQEANTNRFYDEVEARVAQATDRQDKVTDWFELASPYLAMRAVSTSLSATDRSHHLDFLDDAENYRRRFVEDMNLAEMKKQQPGDSPKDRRLFWARVPEFPFDFVSPIKDLRRSLIALSCIIVWAVTMSVASLCVAPRTSRIR